MNSYSKEVIDNNFKYHEPKPGQNDKYNAVREKLKEAAYLLEDTCPTGREKSLAMTKLEEAMFWANASIARDRGPAILSNQGRG